MRGKLGEGNSCVRDGGDCRIGRKCKLLFRDKGAATVSVRLGDKIVAVKTFTCNTEKDVTASCFP